MRQETAPTMHKFTAKTHAVTQNPQAGSYRGNDVYLPEETVANFDGAPAALSGREDNVSTARSQQSFHVGDGAGSGQVS